MFADYLYRLDHANGIDVSGQTNLEGLVANLALESPDEVLRANGDEQLVYLFDVSRELHVEEVEVEGEFGRAYTRIENVPSENRRTGVLSYLSVLAFLKDQNLSLVVGT